jgi:flagellar basal-body rod modification protein FlgD
MDITGIGTSDPKAQQAPAKSLVDLSDNFDRFLTLLTAQLRYQDPLSPMESTEFTAQLVQFAGVEQAIRTNEQLTELIAMQQGNAAAAALGYIGHTVEVVGDEVRLEDGRAEFSYGLENVAGTTAIAITNEAGQVVYAANGETTAGKHRFQWDGKGNAGQQLPDGVYRVAVSAVDLDGAPMTAETYSFGRVTSVEIDEAGATLSVGRLKVPLDKVIAIHETPPPAAQG